MLANTLHTTDQSMLYLKDSSLLEGNALLAFSLSSKALVLQKELPTQVVRLSPVEAHLLLPLFYFYPHFVSNETLDIGYISDLPTYFQYLKGEIKLRTNAIFAIEDGMDHLKMRVKSLGITVIRVTNLGYILSSYPPDTNSEERIKKLIPLYQ